MYTKYIEKLYTSNQTQLITKHNINIFYHRYNRSTKVQSIPHAGGRGMNFSGNVFPAFFFKYV